MPSEVTISDNNISLRYISNLVNALKFEATIMNMMSNNMPVENNANTDGA